MYRQPCNLKTVEPLVNFLRETAYPIDQAIDHEVFSNREHSAHAGKSGCHVHTTAYSDVIGGKVLRKNADRIAPLQLNDALFFQLGDFFLAQSGKVGINFLVIMSDRD